MTKRRRKASAATPAAAAASTPVAAQSEAPTEGPGAADGSVAEKPVVEAAATAEQQAPDGSTPARRRFSRRARFVTAFAFGLFAVLALATGGLYAFDQQYAGRILPGVRVGTVDVGGLTADQAAARLAAAYRSVSDGRIVLHGDTRQAATAFGDLGRRADVDAMVDEAMAVGRAGDPLERVVGSARTAIRGIALAPRIAFDQAAIERVVTAFAAATDRAPVDATIEVVAGAPTVRPGTAGREVDRAAALALATAQLAAADTGTELSIDVPTTLVDPDVTTAEATSARDRADLVARDLVVLDAKGSWTIPATTVRSWLSFARSAGGVLEPVVTTTGIETELATVAKTVNQPPVNASYLTGRDGEIVGVTAGQKGRQLDLPATLANVTDLLRHRADGIVQTSVFVAAIETDPPLSTEEATASAPLMKKISEWETYFPIGISNGYGANIWIPALDINGQVVAPGELFDFWKAIGPVTREHGYKSGGAIINGVTEPQGALAGGICSCSTTLFNAALRAGFEMGARRNHYYYIGRYPLGLDATVFASGSGSVQTMSWRNDTDYPVLIRGMKIQKGGSGYVRFELYSVPNGRTVTLSAPVVKNVKKASDTLKYTSELKAGVRQRLTLPVDGKDVWVVRTVKDATGKVIHQETYYSHYSRITGVVLVGTGGSTPPPTPTPTPTPSP